MHQLKLYLLFHKNLLRFNLPFSLVVGVMGGAIADNSLVGVINSFSLSLLTGSFILSVYFYEQRYQDQYYFYHNAGISKVALLAGSYLLNVAVVILLFFLKLYVYA